MGWSYIRCHQPQSNGWAKQRDGVQMLPPLLNGKAPHDLLLLLLHIRERKPGVDKIDRAGCVSALEHAVLAHHYLLPIAFAIPPLEVLVACEPLWDRASLGVVALGEEEAQ
jgi:hypothetical protein